MPKMTTAALNRSKVSTTPGLNAMADNTVGGDVEYFGESAPGTPTNVAGFRIVKHTYDANGNFLTKLHAGGTDEFTQIWDDRASLIYS